MSSSKQEIKELYRLAIMAAVVMTVATIIQLVMGEYLNLIALTLSLGLTVRAIIILKRML